MEIENLRTPWQVKASAGEPLSVVHVRDLQTTIRAAADAWGRENKEQPVSISAELWLAQPFQNAASDDRVSDDTVHYGLLSKAILSSLARIGHDDTSHGTSGSSLTLGQVVAHLLDGVTHAGEKIFCDSKRLRYARLTVALPKASLLGEAVSLSHHRSRPTPSKPLLWSQDLQIHGLRVPTLIGVNDNERKAKQVVVADVHIEKVHSALDFYPQLEARIVQIMEESSFETLEALITTMAGAIASFLSDETNEKKLWQIRIGLEKPTAIPLAQAARVEYRHAPNHT